MGRRVNNNRPLAVGEYAVQSFGKDVSLKPLSRMIPNPAFPNEKLLIDRHLEFITADRTIAETLTHQVAIVRDRQKPIAILPPCSRKLS